jgi:hypothetical protein
MLPYFLWIQYFPSVHCLLLFLLNRCFPLIRYFRLDPSLLKLPYFPYFPSDLILLLNPYFRLDPKLLCFPSLPYSRLDLKFLLRLWYQ